MTYHKQIADLVTKECAKGTSHRKVLEPLANMFASVLAGINIEHGVDDRQLMYSQIDKMYDEYRKKYAEQKIDTPDTRSVM